jgi:hypothetical protein
VIRSETTSGITVIRIAFTHSVPTGSLTARSSEAASGDADAGRGTDGEAGGEGREWLRGRR